MLTDDEWEILTDRVKKKDVTPFLGAGASYGLIPLGGDIAQEWAEEFSYPFQDKSNLIRVAQFVAVKRDRMTPKYLLLDKIRNSPVPDFNDPTQTHRAIADLRLPTYITTNYDSLMSEALRYCDRDVVREFYRWNGYLKEYSPPSIFKRESKYLPSTARPLVYHLHGTDESPDSLVLIEDDYIEFLANTGQKKYELPAVIRRALTASSLLFIGYSIADWNFRVLLASLNRYQSIGGTRLNVAVMPIPSGAESKPEEVQAYLTQYYADMKVRVHWDSAKDFLVELHQRLVT